MLEEGLNCILTSTDELPRILSNESREKISKSRKGIKFSQETKDKITQSKIGKKYNSNKDINNPMIFNNIWKENLREGLIKSKGKPIYQYDLDGNFIREWRCSSLAEEYLGNKGKSNISACCRGEQNTSYGYKWKYKN